MGWVLAAFDTTPDGTIQRNQSDCKTDAGSGEPDGPVELFLKSGDNGYRRSGDANQPVKEDLRSVHR